MENRILLLTTIIVLIAHYTIATTYNHALGKPTDSDSVWSDDINYSSLPTPS